MSEQPTRQSRTRFARLYSDGGMIVLPVKYDFIEARRELLQDGDDDDVELLEVEVTVVRTHGRPKLQAVREHSARCPTCGDTVYVEVPSDAG